MSSLSFFENGSRLNTCDLGRIADLLTSLADTNVQANLTSDTIATWVEAKTLTAVLQLLGLDPKDFATRTLTTGATASNVLGLCAGRKHAIKRIKGAHWSVAEHGFGGADAQVFCAGAHASILKAAALSGIGRANVREVTTPNDPTQPCAFDLTELERCLKQCQLAQQGSVVVASIGEVNTGGCTPHLDQVRILCDQYGAWLWVLKHHT